MMRRRTLLLAGVAALAVAVIGVTVTLGAPDTALKWSVFGGGGNAASSTSYRLGSTAGQPAIGQSSSTNYRIGAGYWYGAGPPPKQVEPGDGDGDGCSDQRENGLSAMTGGLRNYLNPYDFFDVFGQGLNPVKDKKIDVPNDILPVVLAYGDGPNDPGGGVNPAQYSTAKDRGPAVVGALYSWQRTGPDGKVDVPNDLLPIILQYNHSCV